MKPRKGAYVLLAAIILFGAFNNGLAGTVGTAPLQPWETEHVDWFPGAMVGTHVSIAHHPTTGAAYISDYDAVSENLKLAHEVGPGEGNCTGSDDWLCETIDSDGDVGQYSSIDIVRVPADYPIPSYTKIGISYYDATNGALKYASWRSFPVPASWTIQEVDDSDLFGSIRGTYSSMKFGYDHNPFIGYHTQIIAPSMSGSIRRAVYVGAGTGNCGDGSNWDCETIDTMSDQIGNGTHVSVDVNHEGTIEVAFYDAWNSQLVWAHYQGFGGSCSNTAWNCVTVDGAGDVGKYVSISAPKSVSDKLRFAYYDETTVGKVKYAVAVGSGGNCTSSAFDCFDVDDVGYPAGHVGLSMTMDAQGFPIIAYLDALPELGPMKLNIARPATAYGLDWGNCGEELPGEC